MRFVSQVPTQMLIARIRGQGRCLVFSTMGTSPGQGADEHYVRGFVTQLDHIVEFYSDRFDEVFDSGAEIVGLGYPADATILDAPRQGRGVTTPVASPATPPQPATAHPATQPPAGWTSMSPRGERSGT